MIFSHCSSSSLKSPAKWGHIYVYALPIPCTPKKSKQTHTSHNSVTFSGPTAYAEFLSKIFLNGRPGISPLICLKYVHGGDSTTETDLTATLLKRMSTALESGISLKPQTLTLTLKAPPRLASMSTMPHKCPAWPDQLWYDFLAWKEDTVEQRSLTREQGLDTVFGSWEKSHKVAPTQSQMSPPVSWERHTWTNIDKKIAKNLSGYLCDGKVLDLTSL